MAGEAGSVGQERGEPLYPPVGRVVVELNAAFEQ
jgi:hypothetical protein